MKLSDIARLLSGDIDSGAFSVACAQEIAERRSLVGTNGLAVKRGAVIPVRVLDDCAISVSQADVASLCRHFAQGEVDAVTLSDIADALQLAENVTWADDDVAEYVAEFTDPEINGPFTVTRAIEIVSDAP